jgi:hypothetical protein
MSRTLRVNVVYTLMVAGDYGGLMEGRGKVCGHLRVGGADAVHYRQEANLRVDAAV